jgi:LysM repeat protein
VSAPRDPRYVRIAVEGTGLAEAYLLDDDVAPVLDGGYGGWQDQPRDRRRALLAFTGPGSWTVTLGLYLGAPLGLNVGLMRRQWQVLQALWSIPHPGHTPPLATLEGRALLLPKVQAASEGWALTEVSQRMAERADAAGRQVQAGELVRWAGTVTFARVTPSETLRITQGPNAGKRVHVVKEGETLGKIAAAEHVKAKDIRRLNGDRIRDPKRVKVHDRLWLPPRGKKA